MSHCEHCFRAGLEAAAKVLDAANAADEKRVPGDSMVKNLVLVIRREHAKAIRALAPVVQPAPIEVEPARVEAPHASGCDWPYGDGAECCCQPAPRDAHMLHSCKIGHVHRTSEAMRNCDANGAQPAPDDGARCGECGGIGTRWPHVPVSMFGDLAKCPACGGTGRSRFANSERNGEEKR